MFKTTAPTRNEALKLPEPRQTGLFCLAKDNRPFHDLEVDRRKLVDGVCEFNIFRYGRTRWVTQMRGVIVRGLNILKSDDF